MAHLTRFGVSMEDELLNLFDQYIQRGGYKNRSEALRDLIRQSFVKDEWQKNAMVAGVILVVYNHHKRELVDTLLNIAHDFQGLIVCTQHVHLDHDNCLETIVVKGKARIIQELHDQIKACKGVKHVALSMTTTGERIV
ncbi:MAG: nickel-responsive transcriptional regulator NikR [Candidatus Omnitrophota bacterium]